MGKSTILVRSVAVCAVTAVAGGVMTGVPVSAQAPGAPSSSVATPNRSVALRAPVGGDGVTPRAARATGLRIKIVGVTAGGRASVKVTGPKQSKRKKAKKYSKVIHQTAKLRVRPGVYRVTSRSVAAAGGTDMLTTVATKKLRVRKNKLTRFTVRYTFVSSCASSAVGGTGPGGGTVFFKDLTRTPGSQCMEFAPSGWNTGIDPAKAWGFDNSATSGGVNCVTLNIAGTLTTIGSGAANTNAITAACNATEAPAAWAAKNYTGGAVSWFLPSRDELNQVCRYANSQAFDASATTCTGSGSLVGGFAVDYYWSSSQNVANVAWYQNSRDGDQFTINKNDTLRVRPVRAF